MSPSIPASIVLDAHILHEAYAALRRIRFL
jgi:hypothetical protein